MKDLTRREFLEVSGSALAGGLLASNALLTNQAEAAQQGASTQSAGDVISLPKGGGAIKGIGETFKPNLFTGTANFSVPIATSPGRGGFGPELNLQYSSGNGNGPFGLGWTLSVPQVSRKTEKGIPCYRDDSNDPQEQDIFVLSGSEDLVERIDRPPRDDGNFRVTSYRPRVEGLFARIEKWERKRGSSSSGFSDVFWKITTKENITSIYGRTQKATLAHPEKKKIFKWLLELTYDAKGNFIHYEYKPEDGAGIPDEIYERNRGRSQTYLKRIRYGNLTSLDPYNASAIERLFTSPLVDQDHFFMVVFDYGEHGIASPPHELITGDIYRESKPWDVRPDPFSGYRAGFEIRTHRRCKRVLMFHNSIPGESDPVLVKSTDFLYKENDDTRISLPAGVTQRGYKKISPSGNFESEEIELGEPGVRSTIYQIKSIPRLDFGYSEFKPKEQSFKSLKGKSGDMPPKGLNDPNFALVDLFGTGLPDVLQTTSTEYCYWRNLGEGVLDRRNKLKNYPAGITLDQEGVGFGDMGGDGQADLLVHSGKAWGFYEATNKGGWKTFRPYKTRPTFSLNDPNVRLVDLTGNGKADVFRTDDTHFTYFPCLGEEGFDKPTMRRRIYKLNDFPNVYFSDERVRLADMTGDGLKDIVLIHSGRIDYWPNLGHGNWGKRVTMKNSPRFGQDFDPKRLFLVDIDGSGPADLVYVESGNVHFWFNQSGNAWSEENVINGTPMVTNMDSIELTDMYGNGTVGVLFSTDYRGSGRSHYWFLDFTGGVKPYVLTEMTNDMGATTKAQYKSSTYFYLQDRKRLGKQNPWVTTIPFPVQALEKVEVIDHIAKSKLVTKYSYHHGYYDGREREFRGFGRVEQLETEVFDDYNVSGLHGDTIAFKTTDQNTHVPPTLTKSWFHTGVYKDEKEHIEVFRSEYHKGDNKAFKAHSTVEIGDAPFEAYRALKGANLRTEVYAVDGTPEAQHPYTVTENGSQVKKIQDKGNNSSSIFFATSVESFNFHYERNPADPRISHKITHEVDNYGNILKSLDIVYPKRNPFYTEQGQFYIIYENNQFINQDDPALPYFVGINYESKKIELNVVNLPNTPLRPAGFDPKDIASLNIDDLSNNLFSNTRNYYDGPAYKGLPLAQIGSRGLLTRKETLAFKTGQTATIYKGKVQSSDLIGAGYIESPADPDNWWVQTRRTKYADRTKFFMPVGQLDPMGQLDSTGTPTGHETTIEYDSLSLLPVRTKAPLQTDITAENDYRTISPYLTVDPNKNHTQAEFDPLGMVIATALKGKVDQQGKIEGDSIDHPTTRLEYDFFNYWKTIKANPNDPKPNFVQTWKREEHYTIDPNSREQESYTYSDGFGREIQTKIQAEPDPANGNPRWVGSGWKVYNNKGWIVQQYEPFFSDTHEFEDEKKIGISAKMTFDPLGRTIRTDNPDGSFSKIEFGPWHQTTWDSNDTVTDLTNPDGTFVNKWYAEKSNGTPEEHDAAAKALVHKDTPTVVHLDTLGRSFLSIEDNGTYGKYETSSEFDIHGNVSKVVDPRSNKAFEHKYDLLKNPCHRWQMDSGERFILLNAAGNPVKKWDSRDHLVETKYDELNRPTELWVTQLAPNRKRLAEKTVYGESQANPENNNLKGQIYQQYDGAGRVTFEEYDFKGNLSKSKQQVLKDYKTPVDWSANPPPAFTSNLPFECSAEFNALNRIKEFTTPDGSRYVPAYNEANLLDKLEVYIRGAGSSVSFVQNVNYNAKGQREIIKYGNDVITSYGYDPDTFRLTSLRSFKNRKDFQNYLYTYDPVGNITKIEDQSSQTIYFDNNIVNADRDFKYDPLYRLLEATGREHIGQLTAGECPKDKDVLLITSIPDPNNPNAMRRYKQMYKYDGAGNILEMRTVNQWFRTYTYNSNNNRLIRTTCGQNQTDPFDYQHEAHGNHVDFPHIQSISWDFKDQMVSADLGNGGKAYYLYDSSGQRIRKVVKFQNGVVKERIYLGGYEIFRQYTSETNLNNDIVKTRRDTLHGMDDKRRIAMVETLVTENHADISNPTPRSHYQLADHLGSSIVEVDENAKSITFKEYYPFGGTSYHSTDSTLQVSQKRYGYSAKEKDEETGFYYYGARYYVPWLSRWISYDPAGEEVGICLYTFVRNNPVRLIDSEGKSPDEGTQEIKPVAQPILDINKVVSKEQKLLQEQVLPQVFLKISEAEITEKTKSPTIPGNKENLKYFPGEKVKIEFSGHESVVPWHCTDLVYNSGYLTGYEVPHGKTHYKSTNWVLANIPKLEEQGIIKTVETPQDDPKTPQDESTMYIKAGDILVWGKEEGGQYGHHAIVLNKDPLNHEAVFFREAGRMVIKDSKDILQSRAIHPHDRDAAVYRLNKIDWNRVKENYIKNPSYKAIFDDAYRAAKSLPQ